METVENIGPIIQKSNGEGVGCLPAQAVRLARITAPLTLITKGAKESEVRAFRNAVERCFQERQIDFIVMPTLLESPPERRRAKNILKFESGVMNKISPLAPVNLLGLPALVLPLPPLPGNFPVSLQLIGPPNSEAAMLAAARIIEASG